MSFEPLDRSLDHQRLRDQGYETSLTPLGNLIVDHVPYVNNQRQILYAKLVFQPSTIPDKVSDPTREFLALWTGQIPCDQNGIPLANAIEASQTTPELELTIKYSLSLRLTQFHTDYYAMVTAYVKMLSSHATAIDQTVTAQTFRIREHEKSDYPFVYPDTASSRAGIVALTDRLRGQRLAIVGLGGTGSYILDLVAKTPVKEIHLFDGDDFLSHNAFRAPGAASLAELNTHPKKVARLCDLYSAMKKGIVPHEYGIKDSNVEELQGLDFVFLSMEGGHAKRTITERLTDWGISFIDVGLGIKTSGDILTGVVRVTASTPDQREHIQSRVDFNDPNPEDLYDQNIQISDLNALNAALAVIKWKKLMGVYTDLENEHFTAYSLDGNHMVNEDQR